MKHSEVLMKALFLEHKYASLLKEITAQKILFKDQYIYWATFFKIAQYQTVCHRIIANNFPK